MNWIQIHCQVEKSQVALVEAILYRYGAVSILLENATEIQLFEPMPGTSPLWEDVVVVGLFDAALFSTSTPTSSDSASSSTVLNTVLNIESIQSHISQETKLQRTWVSNLEDKAWERVWMEHYHPVKCAENLWIIPKWLTPPNPDATNVLIDPGLAFGTGYHASTQLCLAWLATQDLAGKLVIDYGCGSGILGIAALKLGAKYVYAVDIDPQAVTATQQNATLNGLADKIWAGLPEDFETHKTQTHKKATDTPLQTDVLVANILAKPLKQLAPYFATLCKPQGSIVLAGLIEPQVDDIRSTYATWFELPEKDSLPENWIRLAGLRKSTDK